MAVAEIIAEEDGLIVDLVVGGMSKTEAREIVAARPVDARRVDAVARSLRLLDSTPAAEPPADLVESTLARIDARD